jgi:outer membrane receptor for ferrienterochelin and colicins
MLKKNLLLLVMLCLSSSSLVFAQGILQGVIVERGTNETLIGANVQVQSSEGLSRGTTTGLNGDFSLRLPEGTYTVRVSYVGYTDRTINDISVRNGETTTLNIELNLGISLNPVVISASKAAEKVNEAPASIQVVTARELESVSTASAADYVKGLASVDVAQQGIISQTVVTRGFNNIFSGSLHVLVDNRIASIPSLRANVLHFVQITNDDIDQIELVLGPGSALYGPNVNSGVMHMITKSPFTSQGTNVSISGGEQSYYKFQLRTAHTLSDKLGVRFSTQYISAKDFSLQESQWDDQLLYDTYARTQLPSSNPDHLPRFDLPGDFNQYRLNELAGRARYLYGDGTPGGRGDDSNPIGIRSLDIEKLAFDTNVEYRINPRSQFILSGGYNTARNIDLTGLGAGQAVDWSLYYVQGRYTYDNWFVQAYLNGTNSGDTYIIPTGLSIIDKSQVFVSQVQHSTDVDRLSLIYGLDYILTTPRTEGTINGQYEAIDQVNEIGGYLQAKYALNEKIDLLGSFRADNHSELQNLVLSPRAALVFKPSGTQTLRATYNRSFSTPSSNNLWLDLQAATVPTPFSQSLGLTYQVRAQGVPSSGFNFSRGADGRPLWYSPANPNGKDVAMELNSAQGWAFLAPILAAGIQNGLTGIYQQQGMSAADAQAQAQSDVQGMDFSNPANIGLNLAALNTATSTFSPVTDVNDIARMKPTVYNTFEIGYKGILDNRLLLSADLYYTRASNFVGPLIVETPNVFMNRTDMQNYMQQMIADNTSLNEGQAALVAVPVAQALSGLPIGIVSPDETFHKDAMVVTYRNFGEIDFFGLDLGFELLLNDEFRVMGNYSFISDDRWLNLDNNPDFNIYLNAPQNKGMFGVAYAGLRNGYSGNLRARYVQGFVIESGIYNTRNAQGNHVPLEDYLILDLTSSYRIKQLPGLTASLQVYNLLDNQKPQFAGTPDIGRLTLLGLSYNF